MNKDDKLQGDWSDDDINNETSWEHRKFLEELAERQSYSEEEWDEYFLSRPERKIFKRPKTQKDIIEDSIKNSENITLIKNGVEIPSHKFTKLELLCALIQRPKIYERCKIKDNKVYIVEKLHLHEWVDECYFDLHLEN